MQYLHVNYQRSFSHKKNSLIKYFLTRQRIVSEIYFFIHYYSIGLHVSGYLPRSLILPMLLKYSTQWIQEMQKLTSKREKCFK